ncbi:MAG: 3-phosphoshikimate 1-carboxyvinyltransferase [Bacteroidales bacterium]|nr:3-phosphoshikimate 1-carboxyvinyltransferase [Bacteroidales bacterium]
MGTADQYPLSSLRAQTRNLLNNRDASSCSGDGGSLSAMTARGCAMRTRNGRVVRFGEVVLPASKSESNRALMIAAYGGFAPDFQNLSDSGDTMVLSEALRKAQSVESIIDIADCGTAARFLTTYLACHEGDWLLTGTDRMKQRPMAPLVEALRSLGADIQYVENEGCLPLHIKGKTISGGKVQMDTTRSSQFASSLLLAAPMWPQGLEMDLVGHLSSVPYLQMTLAMMRHFGAECELQGERVVVSPKPYEPKDFAVDPDWSAASYWYEMAAFSEECEIRLHGLAGLVVPEPAVPEAPRRVEGPTGSVTSACWQGDAIIAEWMTHLGVGTFVDGNDLILRKIPFEKRPLSFDFYDHPDLYPTLAATCAGLHVEACFTGLDNLHLKESDRVEAMQQELAKLGEPETHFCAHGDHRIVMALAPLSMLVGPVAFDHPEVVAKSYPSFWNDTSFLHILP